MRLRWSRSLAVIATGAILLGACGGDDNGGSGSTGSTGTFR